MYAKTMELKFSLLEQLLLSDYKSCKILLNHQYVNGGPLRGSEWQSKMGRQVLCFLRRTSQREVNNFPKVNEVEVEQQCNLK